MKTKEQVSLDRQSCHERTNVNIGVCSDRKERREEERERNGPCFFPSFTLCVPRLKASRSFRQQRSEVHVWGSSCQAWAGPGEVATSKGEVDTEKVPVLNSGPGTAWGWFLHCQAMWYGNVIGLNSVRGCLSLLDGTWQVRGSICQSCWCQHEHIGFDVHERFCTWVHLR